MFEIGKGVVMDEANALSILAKNMPIHFDNAIDLILKCTGRVIVVGIGKSWHICKKIASTLASTGQPSFAVHPGEAQHGDLGMIVKDDVVILLSYSGASAELFAVIDYAKYLGIKTICITGNSESYIAKNVDIALVLPMLREAGSLTHAPTVSSTMMLALGDAISVSVSEKRGFADEQFKVFHPGGAIGKELLNANDIMRVGSDIPLVHTGCDIGSAMIAMSEGHVGAVGVVTEDGVLCGIVTDGDLRRNMRSDVFTMEVNKIMSKNPIWVSGNMRLKDVLNLMNTNKITVVFVCESNIPVGCIHIHDVLRALK